MPRTGGVYTAPAGTKGVPNTTILSAPYNAFVDDLVADANAARPITAGGTGATSASAARTALAVPGLATTNTFTAAQTFSGADADGETIISFSTERPWHWRQRGSGSGADLSLENTTQKLVGMSNDTTWAQHNIVFNPAASGGYIRVNNNTVYHAGNLTSAVVGGLIAAMGAADIGGYVFARRNNSAAVTTGQTSPGSELLYARLNTDGSVGTNVTALTGTWMLCGATHPGSAGSMTVTTNLWKKVAA